MTNKNPAISVVMSVFNGDKYLSEAIQSILSQTFADFEFIIINDGSTDNSLSIIESYMSEDDRIVLLNRKNRGLAASLNEAISTARGQYIARMDSDDISLPKRLAIQYNFLEKNYKIDVLGTNAFQIDENGRKKRRFFLSSKKFLLSKNDSQLKANLMFSSCFVHPTVMMRKSIVDSLRTVYDPGFRVSQDYELWCRLAATATFKNLNLPLLLYRDSKEGLTNSFSSLEKDKNIRAILDAYMSGFPDFNAGLHFGIARSYKDSLSAYSARELVYYVVRVHRYVKRKFGVFGTKFLLYRFYASLRILLHSKLSSLLAENIKTTK